MLRTRMERLKRLTGYEMGEAFTDTPEEREELIVELIRSLGNVDAARKLDEEITTHRRKIRDGRLNLEDKRVEIDEHRSFFNRCCCQVVNRELNSGPNAFLEKDFQRHRFWVVVDACLVELGLRKARENESLGIGTPSKSRENRPSLEERIASYATTRPVLQFPTVTNLSDNERNLLVDVLKDQRGLKRRHDLFSRSNCTLYDRRYVAALRAQVHAAENLASERLEHIRALEARVRELESVTAISLKTTPYSTAAREEPSPVSLSERRRVAGELRDLAHELSMLPDRVAEFVISERKFTATRGSSAKPPFLEELVLLSRGASFDLTTLDLVDLGLCELSEQSVPPNEEK